MDSVNVKQLGYKEINSLIRDKESINITDCMGQRFIAAGSKGKTVCIEGVPGNALGAYLNGGTIRVFANAQDAVGDTMNDGKIVIDGCVGDALGYAMRGGEIYVRDDVGYRAGIHMKEYKDKKPVIVIGGCAGSFLGEYQAGGIIIILGIDIGKRDIIGNFPCTGMHGGKVYLRTTSENIKFPKQVSVRKAEKEDMEQIYGYISEYAKLFNKDERELSESEYIVVTPDTKNPYKQLYVIN